MYPLDTLENIENHEKLATEKNLGGTRLVILLVAQPSLPDGRDILAQFNSIHYQTQRHCGVYVPGFSVSPFPSEYNDSKPFDTIDNAKWWYSDKAFWETIELLENRIQWRCSGESEMIMLHSKTTGKSALDFTNYVSLQIAHGIRKGYYESFPRLFTQIISAAKRQNKSTDALLDVAKQNISIREVVLDAISQLDVKVAAKALKDKAFYVTSAMSAKRRKN